MPSPKSSNSNNTQRNYRAANGRAAEKASSFHGGEGSSSGEGAVPRAWTVPELIRRGGGGGDEDKKQQQLRKVLVKVAVVRSIGPLHVVVPMESTVEDLIAMVVRQYERECRRPVLESNEPSMFDLHYSQFNLESLDRKEKLTELGSRNFFLCPNMNASSSSSSSCFNEAEKPTKKGMTWLKLMDFTR